MLKYFLELGARKMMKEQKMCIVFVLLCFLMILRELGRAGENLVSNYGRM